MGTEILSLVDFSKLVIGGPSAWSSGAIRGKISQHSFSDAAKMYSPSEPGSSGFQNFD
jgi:hypothetical protein